MHRSLALYKKTCPAAVECIKGAQKERRPERKWASATTITWVVSEAVVRTLTFPWREMGSPRKILSSGKM